MTRVAAAVLIRGGKVLLARRAPHKSQAGLWEFPGGKIEPGETPQHALVRELKEELGLTVTPGPEIFAHRHAYAHGMIELISVLCRCENAGDLASTDHDQLAWVAPADLPSYELAPADIPTAERLARGEWRDLLA
ncbi:MAG: (deoxy)nucleoside triphosphate pyrophosphohydrolase [Elusimicrobia bacterium]|nr:(deoxy)nucleoside triphosphate pyrophosphohydrolase [Elusimicrobiota bacterium]